MSHGRLFVRGSNRANVGVPLPKTPPGSVVTVIGIRDLAGKRLHERRDPVRVIDHTKHQNKGILDEAVGQYRQMKSLRMSRKLNDGVLGNHIVPEDR